MDKAIYMSSGLVTIRIFRADSDAYPSMDFRTGIDVLSDYRNNIIFSQLSVEDAAKEKESQGFVKMDLIEYKKLALSHLEEHRLSVEKLK